MRAGSSPNPTEAAAFSKPEVHRPGGKGAVCCTPHPFPSGAASPQPRALTGTRPLPGCSWGRPLARAGEHANLNVNYMQIQSLPLSSSHPVLSPPRPQHLLLPVAHPTQALRPGVPGNTPGLGKHSGVGAFLSAASNVPPKHCLRDPDGGKNLPAWSYTPKNKTFSEYPPSLQLIHKQNPPPPGWAGDHAGHRRGFLKPRRREGGLRSTPCVGGSQPLCLGACFFSKTPPGQRGACMPTSFLPTRQPRKSNLSLPGIC